MLKDGNEALNEIRKDYKHTSSSILKKQIRNFQLKNFFCNYQDKKYTLSYREITYYWIKKNFSNKLILKITYDAS